MSDETFNKEIFLEKLKEILDESLPVPTDDYPVEAMPLGTYVRIIKQDCLGIVVDAFYGDVDTVGTKIILYSVLSLPNAGSLSHLKLSNHHYLSNEYEYDIIGYLMMPPASLPNIKQSLSGDLFI
jgi:hypothetical protein